MMAQENVVSNIFGLTPELYQQQRTALDIAQQQKAATMAAGPGTLLNPSLAPLYAQAAQQGQMFGRGVGGLLGIEDPQLAQIRDVQTMKQQFDVTSPEGLQEFAKALGQKGYTDLALQATTKANQLMKSGAEAQTAKQKIDQEKLLREELNKLPETASDEDLLRVVRKFGTPDQVMKAVQASLDKKAALDQKRVLLDMKNYEQAKTAQQKVQAATDNADRVVSTIDQAVPLVGYNTAGVAGALNLPGTEGRDLETALTTIKANLGFDRLQQMRDASKTGGALGQVAVKELEALQSTVASLDRGQSPEKLRENLKDIKYYYERWRKAVNGEDPGPAVRQRDSEDKKATKSKPGSSKENPIKLQD